MIAQISDGQLQLGGLLDFFKVDVDKYKEAIDKFKKLNVNSAKFIFDDNGKNVANWNAISEAIGDVDNKALGYFQTLDKGNGTINNSSASVKGMSEYLEKTGQAYSFASIKATLFNTALNTGIMFLASLALQAIIKGIDTLIHHTERMREKADEPP